MKPIMRHDTTPDPQTPDLNLECGQLAWSELLPHFARGAVIRVAPELDLIAVAQGFGNNDAVQVQTWLETAAIRRATDDDARRWNQMKPVFRAIVMAPWVLVQERAITNQGLHAC